VLADGAVDGVLLPLVLPELPVPELPVPELPVPELFDLLAAGLLDEPAVPVPAVADPELADDAWCAPGSANATAPAAAMLTAPAVAVTVRSRACPRSRSATARLVACECLLIGCVLLAWVMPQPRCQGWGTPLARL
jgi:hypothetical protein